MQPVRIFIYFVFNLQAYLLFTINVHTYFHNVRHLVLSVEVLRLPQ